MSSFQSDSIINPFKIEIHQNNIKFSYYQHTTKQVSITQVKRLMPHRETISAYYQNHKFPRFQAQFVVRNICTKPNLFTVHFHTYTFAIAVLLLLEAPLTVLFWHESETCCHVFIEFLPQTPKKQERDLWAKFCILRK